MVELVGPWGAGKTTLVSALNRRNPSVRPAPCVWTLPVRLLLIGAMQDLWTIVRLSGAARRIVWKEARQLMRLGASYEDLRRQRHRGGRAVVIDEGPAVMLGWLREVAYESGNGAPPFWWRRAIKRWATTVDIVVFLDAPDPLLARRIRARAQKHPLKDRPDTELAEVLGKYRSTYIDVLRDLRVHGGPTMLAFRTDEVSIEDITDELLKLIENGVNGN